MTRITLLLIALAACPWGLADVTDFEPYREALEALLADEAVPDVDLPGALRALRVQEDPAWPGAVYFGLTGRDDRFQGYAVVDPDAGRLIGFTAALPELPVPMDELPADDLQQVAEAFCQRHFPELAAEGGEVMAQAEEQVRQTGARVFHLQRLVEGVKAPTVAEVGVRVYDGAVVHFRRRHSPLEEGLQLPGTVTEERAREIATEDVPWESMAPVFWFDAERIVVETEDGQRCVWSLWAELRTRTVRHEMLEWFHHWQIDANTEEVVSSETVRQIPRALYLRYVAAGGQHRAGSLVGGLAPEVSFADREPVFSPDGTRLLFRSDRPSVGYPAWSRRPIGLFVVNADGSGLECLAPEAGQYPAWSHDGAKVSSCGPEELVIIDLESGERVSLPMVGDWWTPQEHVWLADGSVVLHRRRHRMESKLWLLDPSQPEAAVELPKVTGPGGSYGPMRVDADGGLLFPVWEHIHMTPSRDQERNRNPYSLWRLHPISPEGEPEMVVEYIKSAQRLVPGPEGKLLAYQRAETGFQVVDPATGSVEAWTSPLPQELGGGYVHLGDVSFRGDGARMAFAARIWDRDGTGLHASAIWTSAPDGSAPERVTPWSAEAVGVEEEEEGQ